VGPAGSDGSPYWIRSDFAGEPLFLDRAAMPQPRGAQYDAFRADAAHWLDDYALGCALRDARWGADWRGWPVPLRDRQPRALQAARRVYREAIEQTCHEQYAFAVQWQALRDHAATRQVRLFGDLPIYVAPDAIDVWAHREQFVVAEDGSLPWVAGVPPDYFSEDGQLWGNPLYDWAQMRDDGFRHWRARISGQCLRFDLLRLDHFRGLAAHWAVPAGAATARAGRWMPSDGLALLDALQRERSPLPLVAEDLGVITPDVEALRDRFGLPGMRVVQFGFDGDENNLHLPHRHVPDCIAYPGTHDNDTTRGWLASLDGETLRRVQHYVGTHAPDTAEALLHATWGSAARLAVLPMQDVLRLGSEARFNTPGTVVGNWSWRLPAGALQDDLAQEWSLRNRTSGRG
jgi:4-alpha-glucanotransferase